MKKKSPSAAFTGAEKLSFLSVRKSQSDLTHEISEITREQKKMRQTCGEKRHQAPTASCKINHRSCSAWSGFRKPETFIRFCLIQLPFSLQGNIGGKAVGGQTEPRVQGINCCRRPTAVIEGRDVDPSGRVGIICQPLPAGKRDGWTHLERCKGP